MRWNPEVYERHARERMQPAKDLANAVRSCNPKTILDVGCGSGLSTQVLVSVFPGAAVTGIDLSPEMLAQAKTILPSVTFLQRDMRGSLAELGKFDLIFCNAAMQWIEDQKDFVRKLYSMLEPNGMLGVQIPLFNEMPASGCIRRAVSEFPKQLGRVRPSYENCHAPGWYYDLFSSLSENMRMWSTDYYHEMDNVRAVLSFVSGTALLPFLEVLDTDEARAFSECVLTELKKHYLPSANGKVLFMFRRLFLTAAKTADPEVHAHD